MWTPHLIILVPSKALSCEDEPVFFGSTLHNPDVADGQPALPYNLQSSQGWEAQRPQEGRDNQIGFQLLGKCDDVEDLTLSKEWSKGQKITIGKWKTTVGKCWNFEKKAFA